MQPHVWIYLENLNYTLYIICNHEFIIDFELNLLYKYYLSYMFMTVDRQVVTSYKSDSFSHGRLVMIIRVVHGLVRVGFVPNLESTWSLWVSHTQTSRWPVKGVSSGV